jgi:hypothetical protein
VVVVQGNASTTAVAVAAGNTNKKVKLSKQPHDLYTLWREYQFGLHGQKPAKDYTTTERGENKSNYCRHKRFWSVVEVMIRWGDTCDTAIDKIYAAHGNNMSMTNILNAMGNNSRKNVHQFE